MKFPQGGGFDMTVILCLDDSKGMLFNNRRLSRDAMVFEDIKTYLNGSLFINEFSEKLIASSGLKYEIFKNFVTNDGSETIYFIENISVKEHLDKIDRIIVYWWNRNYPSDMKLDFDPIEFGFRSTSIYEFVGKSHEKITREIFER